jgi:hypothetical protein
MNAVTWLVIGLMTGALHFAGLRWSMRVRHCGSRMGVRSQRLYAAGAALDGEVKAHTQATESPGATRLAIRVMAGAGAPSTTCSAGLDKDVDGRPAPGMTTSADPAPSRRYSARVSPQVPAPASAAILLALLLAQARFAVTAVVLFIAVHHGAASLLLTGFGTVLARPLAVRIAP